VGTGRPRGGGEEVEEATGSALRELGVLRGHDEPLAGDSLEHGQHQAFAIGRGLAVHRRDAAQRPRDAGEREGRSQATDDRRRVRHPSGREHQLVPLDVLADDLVASAQVPAEDVHEVCVGAIQLAHRGEVVTVLGVGQRCDGRNKVVPFDLRDTGDRDSQPRRCARR
jgi:hypothetical protein